ncbi:RHS repeat protein [Pseudoduganella ginsengisoli]|uniref:RHS repeat protein n=1 Tax=Pseudoduganella ginsengisoli TaxID=1462440 RepID=UPI0014790028|nr:RHS repeat protein [Pseudoduganella ginsengisoli]
MAYSQAKFGPAAWPGNDTVETFSLTGHLQSVTDRNGRITTYTYSDAATPANIAPKAGLLLKVQDPFGQSLQFTYDSQGRMASLVDPAGNSTTYEYDSKSNLSKVTYPDGKSKSYVYNELALTANVARTNALTGIVDENGNRYATFSYAADSKAASTEHAGAVEKYALTYPSYAETQVTDPLGAIYKYTYTERLGVLRSLSTRRPGAGGVGTVTASFGYDANANLTLYTDYDGTMTSYTYDLARNLETSRVEASGTGQARTITTEWHAAFRQPLRIAEPLRRTTFTYDAAANVLTKTVQATTDASGAAGFNATLVGTPRTWAFTYSPLGQILTSKGPRTDVSDITTYTYDEHGNLSTVTNAAGHVTTLSNYDAHGRVGRVTDPNGLVTDFSYTLRGWLSSTTTGNATTSYTYDNAGQLTGVTMPGGVNLNYTYDPAHRLTAITDSSGNSVQYTLDNMGNRVSEQVKDSNGALLRQIARAYDPLNRLKQITGAQQ